MSRASTSFDRVVDTRAKVAAPLFVPWLAWLAFSSLSCQYTSRNHDAENVKIGSKAFTEGVLVSELAAQLCQAGRGSVEHKKQLGGSVILWNALKSGNIDGYPEYTGTIAEELLHGVDGRNLPEIRRKLAPLGISMSEPLGFENTYALGVPGALARELHLRTISDLQTHPDLVFGISHEFMARADGWSGLAQKYSLQVGELRPMDHDVAYKAIEAKQVQVMDLYTTDAEISSLGLVVLDDDREYFPAYRAVLLHRSDLSTRAKSCVEEMYKLQGAITPAHMRAMNAAVKLDHRPEERVAGDFLEKALSIKVEKKEESRATRILRRTSEHLVLTLSSVLMSVAIGLPLGVVCAARPRLRAVILAVAGVVQTIPSLALLVMLIPLLGIGTAPAVAAMILYALFPVLEGTVTGLTTISTPLRESADALGLSWRTRLLRVDLPLASPAVVSGVRTAAVLSVGTATLGAMVGAGGFGQPILTGVRLDSVPTILEGAIPAAALALLVQGVFKWVESRVVPRGLRQVLSKGAKDDVRALLLAGFARARRIRSPCPRRRRGALSRRCSIGRARRGASTSVSDGCALYERPKPTCTTVLEIGRSADRAGREHSSFSRPAARARRVVRSESTSCAPAPAHHRRSDRRGSRHPPPCGNTALLRRPKARGTSPYPRFSRGENAEVFGLPRAQCP